MRATYYISFNGTTYTQFYPSNEPVLKLEQEAGEIFKRWKVDRFRIAKRKNAIIYATLATMFFNPVYFGTEINYQIKINGITKYEFIDTIRAGDFNTQNGVYECTPDPDDDYQPILRQYQKKWDNPSLLFGFSNWIYLPAIASTDFAPVDFNTFTDYLNTVNYTNDGVPAGSNFARNDIPNPVDGTTVTVVITNLSYTGSEPRMKLVDGTYTACSNEVQITADGTYQLLMSGVPASVLLQLSVVNLTGLSKSGSFDYQIYLPQQTLAGATVSDILNMILNTSAYFDLSYNIVSTILWNDPLGSDPPASINTYMSANPANDYVLESAAVFNYLHLTRTDAFTTTKEDNVELSLKDIMDILKSKRLWWFIDEDGKFRIEHDKYFRSYDPQADLTAITYVPYKPEIDKRLYSYEGQNYNQINLVEENAVNEDWTPVRIEYDPLLTSEEIQDQRVAVTTDLKNLLDNPGNASSSGVCLIRCDSVGCVLVDESIITPGNYYPNEKLSPAWFSQYYMDYFAEAETGTLVTGSHTFIHVKETLKQSGVKFKMIADMDWKKPFAMLIGTGWLSSAEYFPETGVYSIDVLYNPYDITYSWENIAVMQIKYGFLYNWYSISHMHGFTITYIANTGSHVPTETEFNTLATYLGGTGICGGKLKETGLTYWNTPNSGADNSSNFNGRGAGERYDDGSFIALKQILGLWSSTEVAGYAKVMQLYDNDPGVTIDDSSYPGTGDDPKNNAASIRLIKDSTTLTNGQTGTYIGNDGKAYRTICIGTQEWLADNLCETLYRDGSPIPEMTDNAGWAALTTGARCSYNNDINNAYIITANVPHTADSTLVTADDTIITVDSDI